MQEVLSVFAQGGGSDGLPFTPTLGTHARVYYIACKPNQQQSLHPYNWGVQAATAMNYEDSQRKRAQYTLASYHLLQVITRITDSLFAATVEPHLQQWYHRCITILTTSQASYSAPEAFPSAPPAPPPLSGPIAPSTAPATAPPRAHPPSATQPRATAPHSASEYALKRPSPFAFSADSQTQARPPQPQPRGAAGGGGGESIWKVEGSQVLSQDDSLYLDLDIPSAQGQ